MQKEQPQNKGKPEGQVSQRIPLEDIERSKGVAGSIKGGQNKTAGPGSTQGPISLGKAADKSAAGDVQLKAIPEGEQTEGALNENDMLLIQYGEGKLPKEKREAVMKLLGQVLGKIKGKVALSYPEDFGVRKYAGDVMVSNRPPTEIQQSLVDWASRVKPLDDPRTSGRTRT
jgi:hypothetical protein